MVLATQLTKIKDKSETTEEAESTEVGDKIRAESLVMMDYNFEC